MNILRVANTKEDGNDCYIQKKPHQKFKWKEFKEFCIVVSLSIFAMFLAAGIPLIFCGL